MTTFTDKEKCLICKEIQLMVNLYAPEELQSKACLYYAQCAVRVLKGYGVRAVIQAGSARFRVVSKAKDDGVSNNAFSYEWSPWSPKSARQLHLNKLPEVHVWAALPETLEVVDMTTRYIPQLAREIGIETDVAWPSCLWGKISDAWDAGCQYMADPVATAFMLFIEQLQLRGVSYANLAPGALAQKVREFESVLAGRDSSSDCN